MRIAAIYDIHGNLPALEAVLEEIRREDVDGIVVGGDVVPGPMPIETIDCLLTIGIPIQFIRGNGDRETLAWMHGQESSAIPEPYRESMRWVARQMRPQDEKLLAGWPLTLRKDIPGLGDVFFCHATPANDTEHAVRSHEGGRPHSAIEVSSGRGIRSPKRPAAAVRAGRAQRAWSRVKSATA
jgi:3',5'-cyclic AMP phosphodiesterase CpdA